MGWWLARAVIYFAVWNVLAWLMWYGSKKHDRTGDPWLVVRMRSVSAIGLFIYVITMSFATVDWIMSREAHWYSAIIGLIVCVSQVLGAFVLAIALLRVMRFSPALGEYLTGPRLNDLGNFFLTFTILWAYVSFSQLLIIWMGNINIESIWYVRRGLGGYGTTHSFWRVIALLLLIAHFFVPFFILLSRHNKRRIENLTMLAMMMLIMRVIDVFWWAGPTSLNLPAIQLDYGNGLLVRKITWLDFLMPPAMFGIWLSVMLLLAKTRPLIAREEQGPDLENGEAHSAHHAA
jgi:hypothetical protein